MIHLTLTGYNAGLPICGVDKQAAKDKGDAFYHYMYWYDMSHPYLCPECVNVINTLDDDPEDKAS